MHAASAPGFQAVAERLAAFRREPAAWRLRYLHGQERMPDGRLVLRLALGAVPEAGAALREAAIAFVRQVCLAERATHYQVLCLSPGAGRRAIREHFRLMMALIHPDRRGAGPAWPADSAQRVNLAYETLDDDRLRRRYGEILRGAAETPAPSRPAGRHRPRAAFVRFARRAMVLAATVAALFMVQAWWVADVPSRFALLERAVPVASSSRWMRDVLADAGLPRFLQASPAEPFEPLPLLAAPRPAEAMVALAVVPDVGPARRAVASPAPAPEPARPASLMSRAHASTALDPVASRLEPAGGDFPVRVAQAAPARPPVAEGPMAIHVETMVALVVSYYEAGDVDALMGLFDPDALGFWGGLRARSAYGDFFEATSARRLRMDRLTWRGGERSARARGDATVIANYPDAGTVERPVSVELEVALRDGQPRLTRLSLFPDA